MTQNELNRAVARATGETVRTIAEMGFVTLMSLTMEQPPQTPHCRRQARRRRASHAKRRVRELAAV